MWLKHSEKTGEYGCVYTSQLIRRLLIIYARNSDGQVLGVMILEPQSNPLLQPHAQS